MDRALPETALDPSDSDFFVHQPTDSLRIELHLTNIEEDCLLSKLRPYIDEGELYLAYEASRNPVSGKKSFEIKAGPADALETLPGRIYLKYLNMRVVEGKRDLSRFIRKERRALLEDAKDSRTQDQVDADAQVLREVEERLEEVNASITKLNYVSSATNSLNNELTKLSYRHANQQLVFGTAATDPADFVENLELVSRVHDKTIGAGGDGRHNQIQLALWTARNQMAAGDQADPDEVTVYCIEEPEAHLHPHQQRKLAAYLAQTLTSQIILTSHSPQIASEFSPSSLIRLYDRDGETVAAAAGCSELIQSEVVNFGYRMSIVPAEAFFASAVLLVEGPSELLFFRALARELAIDLDRLNISVLAVDGVGFDVYGRLLTALAIPFAVRTDNDVFKIPRSDTYRFAGILRALGLARSFCRDFDPTPAGDTALLSGFVNPDQISDDVLEVAGSLRTILAQHGIFVADKDLEHDLCATLTATVLEYAEEQSSAAAIEWMQSAKANFMFGFLQKRSASLSELADSGLAAPLTFCQRLVLG